MQLSLKFKKTNGNNKNSCGIVLYVSKIPTGTFAVKFSVKLLPAKMRFVFWIENLSSFSESRSSFLELLWRSSCSLTNAVVKYLNFCSRGSELESVVCKFTKNCIPSQVFLKEFLHKCRTAVLKNASWWLLLRKSLFCKYSWMAASQGQLQRYVY